MSIGVSPQGKLVHSYLFLRRAIGFIGVGLPVVLIVGKLLIDGGGLLNSISGYYYSDVRGVFVGSMCAVGVFLLSYRGYGRLDDVAADIAAGAAIGVALFPTTPLGARTHTQQLVGAAHATFAAVFFLTLAYFCIVLFRKTDQATPNPRKLGRNRVYLASGVIILACLVLIAVIEGFLGGMIGSLHPVLWLESGAILAFGVAWLTKGEAILGDLRPVVRG